MRITLLMVASVLVGCGPPTYRHEEGKFDRGDAAKALADVKAIAVKECRRVDGPSGGLHIRVRFEQDGSASSSTIDAGSADTPNSLAFKGTPRGECVERRFRDARVRPFRNVKDVRVGTTVHFD